MALGEFVAGAFSATFDPPGLPIATDLGITTDGWEIAATHAAQVINQSDAFGDTVIELIHRGLSSVFINFEAMEWQNILMQAAFPYLATPMVISGATFLDLGIIGSLGSGKGGVLVLSDTAGTPAENKPATLTVTNAIIRENHELRWALTSKLRVLPMSFRAMPYDDVGVIKFMSATAITLAAGWAWRAIELFSAVGSALA